MTQTYKIIFYFFKFFHAQSHGHPSMYNRVHYHIHRPSRGRPFLRDGVPIGQSFLFTRVRSKNFLEISLAISYWANGLMERTLAAVE